VSNEVYLIYHLTQNRSVEWTLSSNSAGPVHCD